MKGLFLAILLSFSSILIGDVIFVSDRLGFTDADEIAPSTMKREVVLAPPYRSKPIGDLQWKEAIEGKEIAVLVHGYNNEYGKAVEFCKKIMQQSQNLYETFVCYLWPGGDHALEYLEARGRVVGILPDRFLSVVNDLVNRGKVVDVFAHSMGCRLALEMMQCPSNVHLRNVFLMAPAVDDEALEEGEVYHEGSKKCRSMFIFHSLNDDVLKWAYPLGDFDRALGLAGSEDVEDLPDHIFQIPSTEYIDSHGDYAGSRFIFKIVADIVNRGAQPSSL